MGSRLNDLAGPVLDQYKVSSRYAGARGSSTDSAEFTHLVPECTNISIGYENEHTPNEAQSWIWLKTVLVPTVKAVDWSSLPVVRPPVHRAPVKSTVVYDEALYMNNVNYGKNKTAPMAVKDITSNTPLFKVPTWVASDGVDYTIPRKSMERWLEGNCGTRANLVSREFVRAMIRSDKLTTISALLMKRLVTVIGKGEPLIDSGDKDLDTLVEHMSTLVHTKNDDMKNIADAIHNDDGKKKTAPPPHKHVVEVDSSAGAWGDTPTIYSLLPTKTLSDMEYSGAVLEVFDTLILARGGLTYKDSMTRWTQVWRNLLDELHDVASDLSITDIDQEVMFEDKEQDKMLSSLLLVLEDLLSDIVVVADDDPSIPGLCLDTLYVLYNLYDLMSESEVMGDPALTVWNTAGELIHRVHTALDFVPDTFNPTRISST